MKYSYEDMLKNDLKINCSRCFGLCCSALYFSACDGFPEDKESGIPCKNLNKDFKCNIHNQLRKKGFKGCTSYDCFGAGQKTAQITFKGTDYYTIPESGSKMFDVFLIIRQLHEMLWYLTEAYELQTNEDMKEKIGALIDDTNELTLLDADLLLKLNVDTHRSRVNVFLKNTSEYIRLKGNNLTIKNKKVHHTDYFGADLRKANLKGADFRGACLIAANLKGADLSYSDFIGADLRDTNICGADLSKSIFLTQGQINCAKGDFNTKLPDKIVKPEYWGKNKE